MRWLLLCCLLLLPGCCAGAQSDGSFLFPSAKDYPAISKSGKKVDDFVPSGWSVIARASGDLNGDGAEDIALVIKGNAKRFQQKNDGLGSEMFDTNPRILLVLFSNKRERSYELAARSDSIIPIPQSPVFAEPLKGVRIANGVLQLDFTLWTSAGSWSASDTSYKFRWIRNGLFLIGAESLQVQRNTGETKSYSYNFLTGQEVVRSGHEDGKLSPARSFNLKVKKLKPLNSFKTLYEWQVAPGEYL